MQVMTYVVINYRLTFIIKYNIQQGDKLNQQIYKLSLIKYNIQQGDKLNQQIYKLSLIKIIRNHYDNCSI